MSAFVRAVRRAGAAFALMLVATARVSGQAPRVDRVPEGLDPGRPLRALQRMADARVRERATERYDPIFQKYTKRYFGIGGDWRRFKAQAMAESELNPNAKSWVGARGLMQLMPTTYRAISSRRPEMKEINDPESNIAAGILHNRYLWRLWEKEVPEAQRWNFMYASYNAGEGTIGRVHRMALESRLDHDHWSTLEQLAPGVQRWRYRETLGYVKKIDRNYAALQERRALTPGRK